MGPTKKKGGEQCSNTVFGSVGSVGVLASGGMIYGGIKLRGDAHVTETNEDGTDIKTETTWIGGDKTIIKSNVKDGTSTETAFFRKGDVDVRIVTNTDTSGQITSATR